MRIPSHAVMLLMLMLLIGFSTQANAESATSEPMAARLAQTDLPAFMAEAKAQGWKAPYIFSRWHVANIAPPEKRAELLRARAFGRQLVDLLDQWAKRVRQPGTSSEDYEHVCVLLDLADWIVVPAGYGNLALFKRSQDIATIPLSRLVINFEFPIEKIHPLTARLAKDGIQPDVLARMLNAEAGSQRITPQMAADKSRTFLYGNLAQKMRNGQLKDMDALTRQKVLTSPVAGQPNLDVFVHDEVKSIGRVFTLSRMWDGKWHETFGNPPMNVRGLPSLAEFRRVIGRFPETKEGFRQAWDRVSNPKNRTMYGTAWIVYTSIREGYFVDHDFFEEQNEARRKKVMQEVEEFNRRMTSPTPLSPDKPR